MRKPERAYNPEYFQLMSAITSLSVACWLEALSSDAVVTNDLRDYENARNYFDQRVAATDSIFEQLKFDVHQEFCDVLENSIRSPKTTLAKLTGELLDNLIVKTMGLVHSKMRVAPHPYSTVTGGFGSGLSSLLMTEVLSRLYSEQHFPGFKAASTLAKIDFTAFTRTGMPAIGVGHGLQQGRSFEGVNLGENSINGLDPTFLQNSGYDLSGDNHGCVALRPPSKTFRNNHADICSNIPTNSGIAQLREYVVLVIDHLIRWAQENGGTEGLTGRISDQDLSILNGTHPRLPKHPQTAAKPPSLIDQPDKHS